jgi:hypothetical protein
MVGFYLNSDHLIKQEQYKDLLREAEHYRLTRAIAQPRSKPWHKATGALRRALIGLRRDLPVLEQSGRAHA